jgi:hypothetical protein
MTSPRQWPGTLRWRSTSTAPPCKTWREEGARNRVPERTAPLCVRGRKSDDRSGLEWSDGRLTVAGGGRCARASRHTICWTPIKDEAGEVVRGLTDRRSLLPHAPVWQGTGVQAPQPRRERGSEHVGGSHSGAGGARAAAVLAALTPAPGAGDHHRACRLSPSRGGRRPPLERVRQVWRDRGNTVSVWWLGFPRN